MPSTNVDIGYWFKVELGRDLLNDGNITYYEMEIEDVVFPEKSTDEVEVTHQRSPNRTREFIQGLTDRGEVSLTCHWIPGSDLEAAAEAAHASGETVVLRYTMPDDVTTKSYAGFVKNWAPAATLGEKMTADLTVRISGEVA